MAFMEKHATGPDVPGHVASLLCENEVLCLDRRVDRYFLKVIKEKNTTVSNSKQTQTKRAEVILLSLVEQYFTKIIFGNRNTCNCTYVLFWHFRNILLQKTVMQKQHFSSR